MTKYEELCEAFRQSSVDGSAYHVRSIEIIAQILTGFVSYVGAPPDRARFLPPEPRDANAIYTPAGAASLQDDGWWLAYIQLTLTQGKNRYPEINALFQFRVQVAAEQYTVRIGDSNQSHIIRDGAKAAALEPIFQEAFERAKKYFSFGLQRFLDEGSKETAPRKIGF